LTVSDTKLITIKLNFELLERGAPPDKGVTRTAVGSLSIIGGLNGSDTGSNSPMGCVGGSVATGSEIGVFSGAATGVGGVPKTK